MEISKEGDWEALLRAEEDWIKSTVDEILQARPAAAAAGGGGCAALRPGAHRRLRGQTPHGARRGA